MCIRDRAYRGYGATQGIFAVESAVNELAHKMGMDPVRIKELNMPVEGGPLPGYPDVPYAQSCTMDKCMARAKAVSYTHLIQVCRFIPKDI